jgi:two-component system, NtrC family, sensor kinase
VKIRLKVMLLIAGIFLVLGAAQVLVESRILMPSFAELERSDARTAMRRIDYALERTLHELALSAVDWGNWADTYQFVEDHNPEFVAANISNLALRQINLNALVIVDRAGRYVEARDLDLLTDKPLGLDLTARTELPSDFPWRANLHDGTAGHGLLHTNRGILMIAAAPVLDGHGHGPSRGMVMLGRLLTPAAVRDLGAQAQTNLAMLPPMAAEKPELVETDELTRVSRAFNDVYNHPILTMRVEVPRRISERGHAAVVYASVCLIAAAVVGLVILVLVLNRAILRPLAILTRHAVALGEDSDLTTRLELSRRDEFGVLGREFDRMVERVAESRMQLVDQSYQAGFSELAKGVLHNLGNAMTPISVRLGRLYDRLRAAPSTDARQAIGELDGAVSDPQRAADLEQFLRLACLELAGTIESAREDVEVITRQTAVIRTTLAEQLRSARNQQVIEPVRLPDLVTQALEIVPEVARQRLGVQIDESLRRVGTVRVARTVLRLVLQNLIINAADAIRDAGKDKGSLRFSAQLVNDDDSQPKLLLNCADDGVGIASENLDRVFENGFSTKSPETNHGIGLHWCANSVGALGGRIWAASDGPGRGASLHVLVPLADREPVALAGIA